VWNKWLRHVNDLYELALLKHGRCIC